MEDKKYGDINSAKKIKSRFKRLEYIYDNSCKKIDDLHKDENICDFKCNQCRIQQLNKTEEINGCCRTCRYQSTSGCTTSNLACKLFFCDEIKNKYKVYKFEDLELLKLLSRRQRFILKYDLFSSREEVLLDLFYGSVLLSGIRLVYSCFKNSYYLLFKNKRKNKYGKLVIFLTLFFTIWNLFFNPWFIVVTVAIGIMDDIIIKLFLEQK